MPVNLPGGLGGLLSKLMGGARKTEGGDGKASKGTMKGKGATKGEALGDEMLLAGMGFSDTDKTKAQKNKAERQNVARFLQDPKAEMAKIKKGEGTEKEAAPEGAETSEAAEAHEAREATEGRESQETNEGRERREVREERNEEGRVQGQESAEQKEKAERKEAQEAQQQREQPDDQDEEGRGAGAWVLEDAEDEQERPPRRQLERDSSPLDEATRCHGTLEDGGRCLRKPQEGSPFCGEHKATSPTGGIGIDQL